MREPSGAKSLSGAWKLEVNNDRVGFLTFDLPNEKVNKLTATAMLELVEALGAIEREGRVKALVIASGKRDCFIAGADVEEIRAVTAETAAYEACRRGQEALQRIADLKVPVLAAIDGACLGGGLELALACHYRIATDNPKTQLGLPETKLGIIPGFGGTQRLPKVVGLQQGLGMILQGSTVDGKKALKIGLVHACVPRARLTEEAVKLALGVKQAPVWIPGYAPKGFMNWVLEKTPPGRNLVFKKALEGVLKATKGHYPAPLKAIDVIRETLSKPLADGLETEARAVAPLVVSEISKNLIHLFFLMEGAKKPKGELENVRPLPVSRVAVLGAGVMGGGIAQLAADRRLQVRMKDIDATFLGKGLQEAYRLFGKRVSRKRMKPHERDFAMGRISTTLSYDGFNTLDVVIEAVVEKLEIKRAVLREVEEASRCRAIFATNTSSLPITQIAEGAKRPDRVVGLHFFNPVSMMPLVEVIRGRDTSRETLATMLALTRALGKTPVLCGDGPGFLVNRLLMPYMNEAVYLLSEGLPVGAVDQAMLSFGMPMGPAHLVDEVGIDIACHVGGFLETCFPDRMRGAALLRQVLEGGLKGKKGGAGFYLYDAAGKKGDLNPAAVKLLPTSVQAPPSEILVERMVLPMINEAARILEEGIVSSPGDVDLGMILGTGFPPFRGGLLRYADTLGAALIADRLSHWAEKAGPRYSPSPPLLAMAKAGRRFYS